MKPVGEGQALLTTDEVAAHLGVTRRTVHNWIKAGELACSQFGEGKGATYRIDLKDVEAFLKKHRRGANISQAGQRAPVARDLARPPGCA
jgi:excisionase family DNA binding protein